MDLITEESGDVWFKQYDITKDCTLLQAPAVVTAKELVAKKTGGADSYDSYFPAYVLVVTWDSVPRINGAPNEVSEKMFVFVDFFLAL